jgi:hypothetical protein
MPEPAPVTMAVRPANRLGNSLALDMAASLLQGTEADAAITASGRLDAAGRQA